MTKTEFVAKLAESASLTKKQAGEVFGAFVGIVSESLKGGQRVSLPGLGTFSCVKRQARKGRNPQTGAEIKIPARTAVKFSTSSVLSKNVSGAKKAPAKAAKKKK